MTTIVSRQQWGAAAPKENIANLAYPVGEIYQHHEGGAVFASLSAADEAAHMRALQADMMNRGYADFAYSVCVFPSGRIYEGRDLGFIGGGEDDMGAATGGHNTNSIAILWPGNLDRQHVTAAQTQGTADILAIAVLAGRVKPTWRYIPHSQATGDSTDCPTDEGRAAMPRVLDAYHGQPATTSEVVKVKPRFDPPLAQVDELIVAGKGAWALYADGGVHTFVGPYQGSMVSDPNFKGRTASRIVKPGTVVPGANAPFKSYPPDQCYEIIATSGERYLPKR